MRFLTLLLIALAVVLPGVAHAQAPHGLPAVSHNHPTGKELAQRMVLALARETRIEVRGTLSARGGAATKYLLRYEASGKESLTVSGGTLSHVQVGRHALSGVRTISIGKTTFRSFDGMHWARLSGTPVPSSLDAVSLNGDDVPCCAGYTKRIHVHLVNKGLVTWHGTRVYRVTFRRGAGGQELTGSVMISASTYLPLAYTETLQPSSNHGSFILSYGGRFEIRAPH